MSKKQSGQRKSLLTGASVLAAAAAAMTATPAMAQTNTSHSNTNASSSSDEAIVVTGTRLVRQDFEAISPVTTVGAEQLELTGTMTTDTLLNELPQVVPGNTRTSNTAGGEAFSTVDLRGLGPGRTLVLLNGERLPASSTDGVVDINSIPASLISRIEVVTGGASAVYGSDAMAGVVNFVLKDDYEGAEISATYGSELSTGNASEFETNMLVGGNFANGRGNMTAYASYYNRNGVLQSQYDFSRLSGAVCYNPAASAGHHYFVCDNRNDVTGSSFVTIGGGSGTPPWGWITNSAAGPGPDKVFGTADDTGNPFGGAAVGNNPGPDKIAGTKDDTPIFAGLGLGGLLPGTFGAGNTDTNCDGIPGGNVRGGNLSFNDAGQLTPRNTSGFCGIPDRTIGSSRYNYAPDNFLIIPAERIGLYVNGHYDINDNLRLSVLANYVNSRQEVQLAPTPATGLTVTLTPTMRNYISTAHHDLWLALMSRPHPYAPFVEDRRTREVGTRNSVNENNEFYFITSLDGSLGDNWDWRLSASYGQSEFLDRQVNSINATAFRQGLSGCKALTAGPDGIFGTADDGETPTTTLPGCVITDIFGPNTLSPAAVDFLRTPTFSETIVEENRVAGYLRGNLFQLPAGPVSTVFGFEYRDTEAQFRVDNEQRSGNIYGFNATQDQAGAIDVYELYTEFAVPLISEQPFAYYLGFEGGYRISNYSSAGNVETWKAGGEWAPTRWLRFRGIYNVATRAPNVFELFQNGDQGFPSFTDPCNDNKNRTPAILAACTATPNAWAMPVGVSTGFLQNNSQVQAFAFGNPNLQPETADTYTVGLVFQPDWFPIGDLRATVDYYNVKISNVIAALGAQFFINDCYTGGNVAGGCARIVRDQTTGQIISVDTTRSNQASFDTSGYDLQVEWSVPVGPGQLTLNELYSHLDSFKFNGREFAGTTSAGVGGTTPDYKSVFSATYTLGDWTFFGRWTYAPSVVSNQGFGTGANRNISPEASYVDLSARWNVTDNFSVTGVLNNVFDDYPPQTADGVFSQANTDPNYYRVLGRSFSVSGRLRF
ncbi:MAG: TonB-dependent receptor [Proteobacteria bacterium]|nr:TonB-dependent receptor [Pseudomonadota bacterium]